MDPVGILPFAKLWYHVVGPNKYELMSICYLLFMAPKTSPSGSVLSLIYCPLLFGNTLIIVSM